MDIFARLARKNASVDPAYLEREYANRVEKKIRERYNINQEFAIQRKRDTEPQEFAEYYAYIESCKAEAKAELGI